MSRETKVDWDRIPAYAVRAHVLRSAEMRRLLGLLFAGIAGRVRRLLRRGPPTRLHPAGC